MVTSSAGFGLTRTVNAAAGLFLNSLIYDIGHGKIMAMHLPGTAKDSFPINGIHKRYGDLSRHQAA